jgi:putative proteasome-type protease
MTYCVGLKLDDGLVLLSDTRTNAGMDNVAVFRKMFEFEVPGERAIVLMTSGSLSVTQTVIAQLEHTAEDPESGPDDSVLKAETMLGVAEIVGRTLNRTSVRINEKMKTMKQSATASILLAGQRRGGDLRLFLIYPEGNFIEATDDTPYLQIGEHKYGKPILDRVVTRQTSLDDGRKAVLLSMDSTLRSNLSVGMPLDLAFIERDSCKISHRDRIEAGDPDFTAMSEAWSSTLRDGFANLK